MDPRAVQHFQGTGLFGPVLYIVVLRELLQLSPLLCAIVWVFRPVESYSNIPSLNRITSPLYSMSISNPQIRVSGPC